MTKNPILDAYQPKDISSPVHASNVATHKKRENAQEARIERIADYVARYDNLKAAGDVDGLKVLYTDCKAQQFEAMAERIGRDVLLMEAE